MKRVPSEWMKYRYYDPKVVLPNLRQIRETLASSNSIPKEVATLRTRRLQPEREAWDAAVFCELLSLAFGLRMMFARVQASDYDAVFRWLDGNSQMYAPVQLKEFVPEELNPEANLQGLVSSLKKYVDSSDLIVGVKLNRNGTIDFNDLDTSGLNLNELWFFGTTAEDQSRWSLFGDVLLEEVHQYEFELPYV